MGGVIVPNTLTMICDVIILVSAVLIAIANIAKFLGHPFKFVKKKQKEEINDCIDSKLKDFGKQRDKELGEKIKVILKEEMPNSSDISKTIMSELTPMLNEIKEINQQQSKRIEVLYDSSKDVLREKIMGIYHSHKKEKSLKIYEKEALDQYYLDYKKEDGNSYIDRYYNRMQTWEIIEPENLCDK